MKKIEKKVDGEFNKYYYDGKVMLVGGQYQPEESSLPVYLLCWGDKLEPVSFIYSSLDEKSIDKLIEKNEDELVWFFEQGIKLAKTDQAVLSSFFNDYIVVSSIDFISIYKDNMLVEGGEMYTKTLGRIKEEYVRRELVKVEKD